ncbi:MAG: recombinase family protein [Oscillospiraceae bacterium]|nr:recombinase family protein [Oscillospiraceae bacterium]
MKTKIAIYSRKSKYTEKGESIGNQIELAKEYIRINYLNININVDVHIYEDEGFSGGTLDRPQFKKMIQDARNKYFNILICYRLDRISRNIADFSGLINELSELDISFISIKEQFDTTTPMRTCNDVYCFRIRTIRKRSNC